jgi:hypothetical protein
VIYPSDLTGVEETLARRVIAMARSIAPGLDDLTDDNATQDAIAILVGVAGVAAGRGSLLIKQQVMGPARVMYTDVPSWFTDDDRAALRALVEANSTPAFGPLGDFPKPSRSVELVFRKPHFRMVEERD